MISSEAPAKLNLTLSVVGRRADGYHLLDSLVAFTEYGDTVAVEASDRLSLAVDGPFASALGDAGGTNLVIRAAEALAAHAGITPRAGIRLTKRLPVASGIGGGSSDAAATLRALSALWALDVPAADLATLALSLGADVPVCLFGGTARLRGIGGNVTPATAVPAVAIVLVNPGIQVSTPAVFRQLNGRFSKEPGEPFEAATDAESLASALARFENDLAAPAIELAPEIAVVLRHLRAAPGCLLARMSGSGATCFGLFADRAADAASTIRAAQPGWWVVATRLKRPAAPRLEASTRSD